MPIPRHRLAVAGVIAVAAVAIPTAALASGPGSPAAKPSASPATAGSASRSKTGHAPAPSAAAAQKAAAKHAQSRTGSPSIAPVLASRLGVSTSAARRAVSQLVALGQGGVDPANPAFATIARDLGVSPARLASALVAAKQSLAGK